jgi:hypothetical protein
MCTPETAFRAPDLARLSDDVLQSKLAIGSVDDPLEREADAAADRVMGTPGGAISLSAGASQISRQCAACDDEEAKKLQAKSHGAARPPAEAPPIVRQVLREPGQPLDAKTRAFFEPRFECDFSQVRVHTDARAADSARLVNAQAYAVGRHISFAAGRFAPGSGQGTRLLAHELAHVVQQGSAHAGSHVVRREGVDTTGASPRPDTPAATAVAAASAGSLKIRWTGTLRGSVFAFMKTLTADQEEAAHLTATIMDFGLRDLEVDAKTATLQQFEARAARDKAFRLGPKITEALLDHFKTDLAGLKRQNEGGEILEELTTSVFGPDIPDTAAVAHDLKEEKKQDVPLQAVTADWAVLKDPALASFYLTLMQQFAALKLTDALAKAATQGLSQADVQQICGDNPKRRYLTGLFTQGWREFTAGGGTSQASFQPLVERIIEQTAWGNPTATHNLLKIGEGTPERGRLGIANRADGMLLYDEMGMPLPSFGGATMRDTGYIGTKQFTWGIDISGITDPALKGILTSLKQQVGDPARGVVIGAQQYFDNMEYVNDIVAKGLGDEVLRRFEGMLPVVLGFIAGKGLSEVLLRLPPPWPLIGLAFKGLLIAAGYVLQVDFFGSALSRLLLAGYHLSRIQREDGQLTALSKLHVEEAAVPLRTLVADMAAMELMGEFMEVLRRGGGASVKCASPCKVELSKERGTEKEKRELDQDRPQRPAKGAEYFDWEGGERGSFGGFVRELRAHIRSLTRAGQPNPLAGLKDDVLDQSTEEFIASRPSLKATWDRWTTSKAGELNKLAAQRRAASGDWRLQSDLDARTDTLEKEYKELADFGKGKVGKKRADLIEIFFAEKRAVMTDITQKVGDPLHGFKSQFYVEVIKALTGYSEVAGQDFDTPMNQKTTR